MHKPGDLTVIDDILIWKSGTAKDVILWSHGKIQSIEGLLYKREKVRKGTP